MPDEFTHNGRKIVISQSGDAVTNAKETKNPGLYLPTGDGPQGHNLNDPMSPWDTAPDQTAIIRTACSPSETVIGTASISISSPTSTQT